MDYTVAEFADKINTLLPAIIKGFNRRQANELYKGKITLPQFLLLDFLSRNGESKMTDLARFMEVTTAAMTGITERLVRDGYVIRASDARDRRIIKIKLTPNGADLVKKINRQRRRMIIEVFGKISAAERRSYLNVLLHIHEILKREGKTGE